MITTKSKIAQRSPTTRPEHFAGSATGVLVGVLVTAFLLAGSGLAAQDAAASTSEDDMFGSPETVTQSSNTSQEATGQSGFLKYDQVKVGGSLTGKFGFTSAWASARDGSAQPFSPTSYYLTPDIEGKVTLVAKPSVDFGVNMDFRTSWPSSTTDTLATTTNGTSINGAKSEMIPNITVWSLYSKFNWQDKVYFSAGKQPLAWGVSRGLFQPADDIFAVSATIDPTNTGAEREGPISLKTTVPLGVTNNLYIFAGLPTSSTGSTKVDPGDARLAIKGEYGFGNTELALAAYYAYNDHPRALIMATTGLGSWNLLGEGVLKYGSERYFLTKNGPFTTGTKAADQFYFSGTAGGYYSDSDARLTIMLQYMYNGEGQTGVSAKDAYLYYMSTPANIDRIKVGTHYAFASISDTNLFPTVCGADKLGASLIAITNLSDFSGYIMPSVTWKFFTYMSLQVGATFSVGQAGGEYITYGVGQTMNFANLPTTPGAALNLLLTVGTGNF